MRILQLARPSSGPSNTFTPATTIGAVSSNTDRHSGRSSRSSSNPPPKIRNGSLERTITYRPTPSRCPISTRNSRMASPARARIRGCMDVGTREPWAVINPHATSSLHSRVATRVLMGMRAGNTEGHAEKNTEVPVEESPESGGENDEVPLAREGRVTDSEGGRWSFVDKVDAQQRIAELELQLAQKVARSAHADETLREVMEYHSDKSKKNEGVILALQEKICEILESKRTLERQLNGALIATEESRGSCITETSKSKSVEEHSTQLRALVVEMLDEAEFWKQQACGAQWRRRLESLVAEEPVMPRSWQQPTWMDSIWGGERSVLRRHYENQITKLQRHIDKLYQQQQDQHQPQTSLGGSSSSCRGRTSSLSHRRGSRSGVLNAQPSQSDLQRNMEQLCRKVKYLQETNKRLETALEERNAYCCILEERLLEKPKRTSESKPPEMRALDVRMAHPGSQHGDEGIGPGIRPGIRPFDGWCQMGLADRASDTSSHSRLSRPSSVRPFRMMKD
eukprot:GEMP01023969.1.p1 GENE.GEMP01023969.1~~GEMP01023969.1.p1  ORF type:complete len:511 (+),score=123.03 GEMP01023969.1:216-1748(+)